MTINLSTKCSEDIYSTQEEFADPEKIEVSISNDTFQLMEKGFSFVRENKGIKSISIESPFQNRCFLDIDGNNFRFGFSIHTSTLEIDKDGDIYGVWLFDGGRLVAEFGNIAALSASADKSA